MKLILLIFKIVFRYLFVFGCVGSSLLCGLCSALQLCCTGLLQWLLLLQSPGLRQLGFGSCSSRVLEHRLRIVAQGLSRSIVWDLPGSGIEPMSPAFAGGFLTTEVPVQFSSVTQSCPPLCDPMNRSTPGLPVRHKLLEFTQTHARRVGDAIQPSLPLPSPSPPAPNPSQHQGLFQRVNSSHEVAKVLEFQLQHQSFQ